MQCDTEGDFSDSRDYISTSNTLHISVWQLDRDGVERGNVELRARPAARDIVREGRMRVYVEEDQMSHLNARMLGAAVLTASLLLVLPAAGVQAARDDDDDAHFIVTVTNLTQGQVFTPIVAASHKNSIKLFHLGQPASEALEVLAESGDTGPLKVALGDSPAVLDIADSGAPLPPGASVMLSVATRGAFRFVSVAAMLVPTNDAFFALNGVEGPRGHEVLTSDSPAYDAGTEVNDELCTHIPGPPTACQGEGFNPARGADNFVHIHPGIHGIGNLSAARYDWRNPVARITIRRAE